MTVDQGKAAGVGKAKQAAFRPLVPQDKMKRERRNLEFYVLDGLLSAKSPEVDVAAIIGLRGRLRGRAADPV